jgi:hypothetical protein
LDDWVTRAVLNPGRPLFREARYLLAEEPELHDTALCHSVLAAIASGNAARGGIADYLGRKSTDLAHAVGLVDLAFGGGSSGHLAHIVHQFSDLALGGHPVVAPPGAADQHLDGVIADPEVEELLLGLLQLRSQPGHLSPGDSIDPLVQRRDDRLQRTFDGPGRE